MHPLTTQLRLGMGVELNQSNSQLCVCQDVLGVLGERVADREVRPELTGLPLELLRDGREIGAGEGV